MEEIDLPARSDFSREKEPSNSPTHCHANCQTPLELVGSCIFGNFSVNFDELEESGGYICTESLSVNNYCNNGSTDMIKQLIVRDQIINICKRYLENLLNHGKSLEKEIKILKCKNEDYSEEIRLQKKLQKKKEKLKKKMVKTRKERAIKLCNKLTQTLKITCNALTQTDTDFTHECNWYREQEKLNLVFSDKYHRLKEGVKEFQNGEDKIFNSGEVSEMDSRVNTLDEKDCNVGYSEITQAIDSSVDPMKKDVEFLCEEVSYKKKDTKGKTMEEINDIGWGSAKIKEEVQAVAEAITNQLGYVFIDEIGMYYDHSSGYYYDDKTSLFYDGRTGTYFYYDHQTNNYEFYAQVDPTPNAVADTSVEMTDKKRKVQKIDQDKEEGECSESEEDEESAENEDVAHIPDLNIADPSNSSTIDFRERHSAEVAPSLRLMVMNRELKGNLHVVTVDGGTIGREGDVQVLLKSPSVSKLHAEISYQSDGLSDHHYFIRDLGSSNGTLVKGQRISESKMPSELIELGHSWEIQCGDVILSCHIHPGLLTCNECEPGLVEGNGRGNAKASAVNRSSKQKLEKERRRQNKAIRKKFSLNWFDGQSPTNPLYKDRSVKRREVVGSDNPYEKTQQASLETNLTKENKGFQLLQKMGWSEGQSLGIGDTGITEPVIPSFSSGRAGLGAALLSQEAFPLPEKNSVYHEMTKERYENASLLQEVRFTAASHNSNGS